MNIKAQAQTKSTPQSSSTPGRSRVEERKCAVSSESGLARASAVYNWSHLALPSRYPNEFQGTATHLTPESNLGHNFGEVRVQPGAERANSVPVTTACPSCAQSDNSSAAEESTLETGEQQSSKEIAATAEG